MYVEGTFIVLNEPPLGNCTCCTSIRTTMASMATALNINGANKVNQNNNNNERNKNSNYMKNQPQIKTIFEIKNINTFKTNLKHRKEDDEKGSSDANNGAVVVNPTNLKNKNLSCATAPGVIFKTNEDLRIHLKSEFHLFNLKRKLSDKEVLNEEDFNTYNNNINNDNEPASPSSSDEENSDKDNNGGGDPFFNLSSINNSLLPLTHFIYDQSWKASVWTCILSNNNTPHPLQFLIEKDVQPIVWIILLYSSNGHFAGTVYHSGRLVAHKTFHRYTSRRKQGGAQSAHDNKSGKARSIGAQVRRANEIELRKEIQELLVKKWKDHVLQARDIFIGCSNRNRSVFYKIPQGAKIKKSALVKNDFKIKYIPFITKRPNLKECENVMKELSSIKYSKLSNMASIVAVTKPNGKIDNTTTTVSSEKKKNEVKPSSISASSQTVPSMTINIDGVNFKNAIKKNDTELVKKILSNDDTMINAIIDAENGSTGLHIAVKSNLYDMVNLLLTRGADPTRQDFHRNVPFKLCGKNKKVRDTFRLF